MNPPTQMLRRTSKIEKLVAELCPEGVEFKELGDCLIKNTGGGTPSRSNSSYWDGDIPWASVGDLSITGNYIQTTRAMITTEGLKNSSSNIIPCGDVIVAVKISPGKMKIAATDIAINQDLRGLTLKSFIDSSFLTYYFQTVSIVAHGTIVKGMTKNMLERVKIPIPPLAIQQEIVKILDTFTTLEAELEAELEARKKQYEYYRDELLTFGDEIQLMTLGDIGKVSMCKRIFKNETSSIGQIPFYKIGTFGKKPNAYISEQIFNEYRNKFSFPQKGDVLLSASGTIGRRVVYDGDPAYFQDSNIIWLEHDESKVLNKFLYHFYAIVKWQTEGGTIQRLYNNNLRKIKIKVPPLAEQERIVAILDKFDALANDISIGLPAELNARRKQYEYYRDRLLTFQEKP
jgi:type I restriction enzyme S subunit